MEYESSQNHFVKTLQRSLVVLEKSYDPLASPFSLSYEGQTKQAARDTIFATILPSFSFMTFTFQQIVESPVGALVGHAKATPGPTTHIVNGGTKTSCSEE